MPCYAVRSTPSTAELCSIVVLSLRINWPCGYFPMGRRDPAPLLSRCGLLGTDSDPNVVISRRYPVGEGQSVLYSSTNDMCSAHCDRCSSC